MATSKSTGEKVVAEDTAIGQRTVSFFFSFLSLYLSFSPFLFASFYSFLSFTLFFYSFLLFMKKQVETVRTGKDSKKNALCGKCGSHDDLKICTGCKKIR